MAPYRRNGENPECDRIGGGAANVSRVFGYEGMTEITNFVIPT